MTDITEGTQLYVPKERWTPAKMVTVTKVGKKWLTLSDCTRADKNTLCRESSRGPANGMRLYRSEEDWKNHIKHIGLWRAFKKEVDKFYSNPPAPPGAIHRAAAALGLSLSMTDSTNEDNA